MPAAPLDSVEDVVRRRGAELIALSHAIHAEPELAFAEQTSEQRWEAYRDAATG